MFENEDALREQLAELSKALGLGHDFPSQIGATNPGDLMPATPQDLDDVMVNQTWRAKKALKLWSILPKGKAYSTVHQFVRFHAYGQQRADEIWTDGAGLPNEDNSTFSLESLEIAYAGSTRRVGLPAQRVKSLLGDVVATENRNGTMQILRGIETSLFYGDRDVNPFSINGLYKSGLNGGIELDAKGEAPTEAMIDEAMSLVGDDPNFGAPSHMFYSTRMHTTLRQLFADRMRSQLGAAFTPRYKLDGMSFDDHDVKFCKHPLAIKERGRPDEAGTGADSNKRPLPPVIIAEPTAAAGGVDSRFEGAGARAGGAFYYRVVAISASGRSTPVNTAIVNVAAGQKVSLTVKDSAVVGSQQSATGFKIYRTQPGEEVSEATYIGQIKASPNGGNTVFEDYNHTLPGTSDIFIVSNVADSLKWVSLMPFTSMPLATVDQARRWMLLMFGALQIGAQRHHAVIRNCAVPAALERRYNENDQSGVQLQRNN